MQSYIYRYKSDMRLVGPKSTQMDDSGDVDMSFSKSSVREKKGVIWYIHIIGYSTSPLISMGSCCLKKGHEERCRVSVEWPGVNKTDFQWSLCGARGLVFGNGYKASSLIGSRRSTKSIQFDVAFPL